MWADIKQTISSRDKELQSRRGILRGIRLFPENLKEYFSVSLHKCINLCLFAACVKSPLAPGTCSALVTHGPAFPKAVTLGFEWREKRRCTVVARGGLREKTVCLGRTLQSKDRHRNPVHPRTQLPGQEQTLQIGTSGCPLITSVWAFEGNV